MRTIDQITSDLAKAEKEGQWSLHLALLKELDQYWKAKRNGKE